MSHCDAARTARTARTARVFGVSPAYPAYPVNPAYPAYPVGTGRIGTLRDPRYVLRCHSESSKPMKSQTFRQVSSLTLS